MTRIFNVAAKKLTRRELRQKSTHSEDMLWRKLKDRRLAGARFRRQYSIGRYVADFYCPQAKLVIEVDGGSHTNPESRAYDKIRDKFTQALGLHVLRFTNQEVRLNMAEVLQAIEDTIKSRSEKRDPSPYEGEGGS